MLTEAGYPNGFTIKLLYSDYRPFWEQEVLAIQDNLGKIFSGVAIFISRVSSYSGVKTPASIGGVSSGGVDSPPEPPMFQLY